MKRNYLLMRTLLLSTSQRNIYRYSKDPKKRKKIIFGYVGVAVLYAMLIGYSAAICIGYGSYGMIESAPVLCALTISALFNLLPNMLIDLLESCQSSFDVLYAL